jgi:Tol biopolymer transport system component
MRDLLAVLKFIGGLALLASLGACGGGGGSGSSGSDPDASGATTGSLVYNEITRIDGRAAYGIHVTNLGSGRTQIFRAIDFVKGGVSVSRNGRVAQLAQGDDTVFLRVTDLAGVVSSEFTFTLRNSFALGGARISPDGSKVAFALRTQENGGEDRVYFCDVQAPYACSYYFNLRDPEWMPDGRIIGISTNRSDFTQLYISNANLQGVNAVGPVSGTPFESPYATPDGTKVIVSLGAAIGVLAAIDVSTGALRPFTSDGAGHKHPVVSTDGRAVFFTHDCCPNPQGNNLTGLFLHAMPLNTSVVTASPIGSFLLQVGGERLGIDSTRFGYTPVTQ